MGIFDSFRSSNQPQGTQNQGGAGNPNQNNQNPAQGSGNQNPGDKSAGAQGQNQNQNGNGSGGDQNKQDSNASPLDKFSALFDTSKHSDPNKNLPGIFEGPIDPNKLAEAASRINFAGALGQDVIADIQAGGEKASAAFVKAINQVAQTVYAQSAMLSRNLVEKAATRVEDRMGNRVQDQLRNFASSTSIMESNPAFSHPAVAPVVKSIGDMVSRAYPDASPAEIRSMTLEYLTNVSAVVAKKDGGDLNGSSGKPDLAGTQDFENFLSN